MFSKSTFSSPLTAITELPKLNTDPTCLHDVMETDELTCDHIGIILLVNLGACGHKVSLQCTLLFSGVSLQQWASA